jgi:hypothetical protein
LAGKPRFPVISVRFRLKFVVPVARCSSLLLLTLLALAASCAASPPPSDAIRFDPCQPVVLAVGASATIDQAAAVQSASAMWNQIGHTRLSSLASSASVPASALTLPVRFQPAAAPSHGYYDPVSGEVLVNTDLRGRPDAITIAHEVGHAFGLVHVAPDQRPSVMNPGNLDTAPTLEDRDALTLLWGQCPSPEEPR